MPIQQKSAADLVAEAKAKAQGIPYQRRPTIDLSTPGKKTKETKRSASPTQLANELTGQYEASPKASSVVSDGKNELTMQSETPPKASSVVSDRKIAANKANGLKSKGPKTAEGKARVSQNALKHGLRSERPPALPHTEDPQSDPRLADLAMDTTLPNEHADFLATLAAFTRDLAPADSIELQMVERLAQIDHRLKRATRLDTATLDHARGQFIQWFTEFPEDGPRKTDPTRVQNNWILADAYRRCAKEHNLISHYEARLSRDYRRTLHDLLALQKLRKQTQPSVMPFKSNERTGPLDGDSQEREHSECVVRDQDSVPLCVVNEETPRVSTSDTPDLPSTSEPTAGGWTSVRTEVSTSEPKQTPPLPTRKNFGQTNPTDREAPSPSTPSNVDTSVLLQPPTPPQETPSNLAHLR